MQSCADYVSEQPLYAYRLSTEVISSVGIIWTCCAILLYYKEVQHSVRWCEGLTNAVITAIKSSAAKKELAALKYQWAIEELQTVIRTSLLRKVILPVPNTSYLDNRVTITPGLCQEN